MATVYRVMPVENSEDKALFSVTNVLTNELKTIDISQSRIDPKLPCAMYTYITVMAYPEARVHTVWKLSKSLGGWLVVCK